MPSANITIKTLSTAATATRCDALSPGGVKFWLGGFCAASSVTANVLEVITTDSVVISLSLSLRINGIRNTDNPWNWPAGWLPMSGAPVLTSCGEVTLWIVLLSARDSLSDMLLTVVSWSHIAVVSSVEVSSEGELDGFAVGLLMGWLQLLTSYRVVVGKGTTDVGQSQMGRQRGIHNICIMTS